MPDSGPPSRASSSAGQRPSASNRRSQTVLDPVTRLEIPIHTTTSDELLATVSTPSSEEPPNLDALQHSQMTGVIDAESRKDEWADDGQKAKVQTALIAAAAALSGAFTILIISRVLGRLMAGWTGWLLASAMCCILSLAAAACVMYFWKAPQVQLHGEETQLHKPEAPESPESPEKALWFNAFLASLWPIVNPALFISVSDMLEDALQASLPKFIHGVRVADIGQGSEALRLLGIRNLEDVDDNRKDDMGDFVNLEVALAHRARPHGKSLKQRSGNPHILMEFLTAGGVVIPVWIELTGLLATARMRIQLMPNPPFLSAMTLTLIGQPKVQLKCTPLTQKFVNIMDVPFVSKWLQSAIDAAVSAYVAPRSLNLDLKTLLSGRDQMDTETVGIIVVIVHSAVGFKDGDGGKFWESQNEKRGDPYVTIGWGKWGKPVWSSRIIENEGNPFWEEIAVLLVGPSELNARERLRLSLWDSDRGATDDLLGNVEVNLHELMEDPKTQNQMSSRTDRFTDTNGTTPWPGELRWDCGYFAKTTLQQHLALKGENIEQLKADVEHHTERELKEADTLQHSGKEEIEQQKQAELKDRGDEIIAESPPTDKWPSGILSIQIEQIQGLVVQKIQGSVVGEAADDEQNEDLPSAYCTIILNHQRVYKTRTKLKTSKPFFAASTERFIKDWRTASVLIAVRDQRLHEVDPLIGVVVLPLHTLFKKRSQVSGAYPLVGGIGFGRVQVSLVFRSVQAQLPPPLVGWDIGTLDVQPHARAKDPLPADLHSCKLVLRTTNGKGKLHAHAEGEWQQKRGKPVRLAVKRRFGECLLVEFRRHALGPDQTPAFCTLWLKDIADNEDTTVSLPIWRSAKGALDRARVNAQAPEGCERVGTLEFTLRLWPGMSGYHKPLAEHDGNFADVMKVLDAAEENEGGDKEHDSLQDSEASSDSEDEDAGAGDESKEESGGLISEVKNYKNHKDELHRKHRGMMQWGAVRKLAWIGHGVESKAEDIENKVKGKFKHNQTEQGMDVEA